MNDLIHRLIQNLRRLLGVGGTVEGVVSLEKGGHWRDVLRAVSCPRPLPDSFCFPATLT
jgi:hypothetical protein